MSKTRKNRHPSEIGKRLEEAIHNAEYGTVSEFAHELSTQPGLPAHETILTNLSNMINHPNPAGWSRKLFLPIERLLNVRIADIIDGTDLHQRSPRGLFEIGTQGSYKDFETLANQTNESIDVLHSYDEWSKSIVDYVYQAKNIEGLRYLVDNGFYRVYSPGKIEVANYGPEDEAEHALTLLEIVEKDEDPNYGLFIKLLDTRKGTDHLDLEPGIFSNEEVLEFMLERSLFLDAVCRVPDLVLESELNTRSRRISVDGEYTALCASNWLTPLLCHALKYEDRYREQAKKLLEFSLEIAKSTLTRIGKNKSILGGEGTSVRTQKGHVLLDHSHVIGVIGEPTTEKEIKDPELKELANKVTAVIGTFRAMSRIQTPTIIDGKLHLPRADYNPIYRRFVLASVGHPYLLRKSNDQAGDAANNVFDMPRGTASKNDFSLEQWKQIGAALKSIHEIDCGIEGKAFCHGRFIHSDIYLLPNGKVELITGYKDVYVGNPEEDVFAIGLFAFKNDAFHPRANQDEIESFLEGYGYPIEGFLQKLWDYLIARAREEENIAEARYLMDSATNVLGVIRKVEQTKMNDEFQG